MKNETDWFEVLLKILDCVGTNEGTCFENEWRDYGVTAEEQEKIEAALKKY